MLHGTGSGSGNWNLMDEGSRSLPEPSPETKELMKKIRLLGNQHLLNDEGTDLKPSAVIKQTNPYLMKEEDKFTAEEQFQLNNVCFTSVHLEGDAEQSSRYWKAIQHTFSAIVPLAFTQLWKAITGDQAAFMEIMSIYYQERFKKDSFKHAYSSFNLMIADSTAVLELYEYDLKLSVNYFDNNIFEPDDEVLPFFMIKLEQTDGFAMWQLREVVNQLERRDYSFVGFRYEGDSATLQQLLEEKYPEALCIQAEVPPLVRDHMEAMQEDE